MLFPSLQFASFSLWFRTELAVHHSVHRGYIPPNHPSDCVRLLEAIQVRTSLFSFLTPYLFIPFLVAFEVELGDMNRISSSSFHYFSRFYKQPFSSMIAILSMRVFLCCRKKHRPVPQRAPIYVEQSENGHDGELFPHF